MDRPGSHRFAEREGSFLRGASANSADRLSAGRSAGGGWPDAKALSQLAGRTARLTRAYSLETSSEGRCPQLSTVVSLHNISYTHINGDRRMSDRRAVPARPETCVCLQLKAGSSSLAAGGLSWKPSHDHHRIRVA